MSEEDKKPENIELPKNNLHGVLMAGDKWLRDLNVLTDVHHNNIITNIYMNYEEVKLAEYFVNREAKTLDLLVHVDINAFVKGVDYLNKVLKWVPSRLLSKKKVEEFLDYLPYMDFPKIKESRQALEEGLKDLIAQYIPSYTVTVEIRRFKGEK